MHHHKQTNLFIPTCLSRRKPKNKTNKQTNEQKHFRYQHAALPTEPKSGTNEQKRFRYQHAALPTEPKNGTNKHTNKQTKNISDTNMPLCRPKPNVQQTNKRFGHQHDGTYRNEKTEQTYKLRSICNVCISTDKTQNTTKPTKHFHPNMAPATKNQKQNNKQTKPFIPTCPPRQNPKTEQTRRVSFPTCHYRLRTKHTHTHTHTQQQQQTNKQTFRIPARSYRRKPKCTTKAARRYLKRFVGLVIADLVPYATWPIEKKRRFVGLLNAVLVSVGNAWHVEKKNVVSAC